MPRAITWQLIVKSLLTIALFVWLVNYANVRFVEIFANLSLAAPRWMLLALVLFVIHTLLIYLAWHRSLALFRLPCGMDVTAPLFAFSALTKYVPGGVWHAGSRVWVLGAKGYSRVSAFFSVILESIYSLVISAALLCLLFGVMQVAFLPDWVSAIPRALVLLLGLLMLLALLLPGCYRLVFDWYYARKLGVTDISNYAPRRLLELVGLHIAALLVFVAGYYVSFAAFLPMQQVGMLQFAFIVLLATFSGFIAIFAPAGLGVRESILYLLFATLIDSPLLVTLCLAPRLLLLIAEVLFFILSKLYSGMRSNGPAGATGE